jgi:hypothetical protein
MEKNKMISRNNTREKRLTLSIRRVRREESRDDKRREIGRSNRTRAATASRDQPRRGKERLGAINIPHRKAREIQNRGMRGIYIKCRTNKII